ncbi:serine/threonine-protein kinase [Thermoactinospora rubra]|uniref:serine/threonine-protein kinase n=1 Tax=Thermoactinospora rubra TaxID=1088767 RepID=UPI001F0A4763|nr:serine/threonine-protein kinase [Thermoactinospora rubra]
MLGDGALLNGRYLLTNRLGAGGMGEVWRAEDTLLGRTVAVKVLLHNPAATARFLNEARAMATLRHPGVADVYDYGSDGVSFLVMELVDGEPLDRLLERGPLGCESTMTLVAQVAEALAAAHERGIVHRDVKPGNLMIRSDGSVVLTDFGIAHSPTAGQLTATGQMLCSAGYCAPEQAGANQVSPAVDIYALGVVAFECLTGRLPYDGDTPVQIIFKHLNAPVPELPEDVPPAVREVVVRALAKDPAKRWPSAAAMAEAARRALAGPPAPTAQQPQQPQEHGRRLARAATAAGAAIVAALAIVASLRVWPPMSANSVPRPSVAPEQPPGRSATTPGLRPAKQRTAPPRDATPSPGASATLAPAPTPLPTAPSTPTPTPTRTPSPEPTTPEPKPSPTPTPPPTPSEEPPPSPTGVPQSGIQSPTEVPQLAGG